MPGIDGLHHLPDYISPERHDRLMRTIDDQPWRGDLARRTQHYGWIYDYRARTVDRSARLGDLPDWLRHIARRLVADGLMPVEPDQAIVNEYEPGQGIADHVDCEPCFGEVVASLSLNATAIMDLKRGNRSEQVFLEPRSLLVLQREARYDWTHGIARRKHDVWNGERRPRRRRVSITFRKVVLLS